MTLRLPFMLGGLGGRVDVTVALTRDPASLGAPQEAAGFAHCEATIDYPGKGYAALFGWVQMVRSTDNSSGGHEFEMDPLAFLGEVPHPFGFFGIRPVLFDAPWRPRRSDLDWHAHSFLCHIADYDRHTVRALTGFSWGFTISGDLTTVAPPRRLAPVDWDRHLDLLHADHPAWRFDTGFHGR